MTDVTSAPHDALTLALRLCVERDESHAPETLEVLKRWRPAIDAVLAGKSREEAIACVVSETVPMSQVNDPTNWNPTEEFDSLEFTSYTHAKKAEVLFNRLIRERDAAKRQACTAEHRTTCSFATPPKTAEANEAARYRWLRDSVRAQNRAFHSDGSFYFLLLPELLPLKGMDLMRGSIQGHMDTIIDHLRSDERERT